MSVTFFLYTGNTKTKLKYIINNCKLTHGKFREIYVEKGSGN